ncbi:glycosyltransferase family 2 protein [Sphingomonas sp. BIUV-7]|uniref:Glycosyltransferase family 2 protein n=1 Tax=Sphingomonas natans TaxID=3063330 RepID=A0ABT8Y4M6_9SPHN|nr:glycosyltransferase family 2 protein [Sphingomonas sp. BIUV-7]MDO6413269.1 glycosyltransferase family 2 protein [Sphingomonas sp. BIUV-7]
MARSIAIVMVNYRTPELALAALASVAGERAAEPGLRAILVDGGSGDGSSETLAAALHGSSLAEWVQLLALPLNGGFGWANNQAIQRLLQGHDPPDYIHLLNPDTRIETGAVSRLADVLDRNARCGAVGSLLLEPDGSPSGSAFAFPSVRRELIRGGRMAILERLFAKGRLVSFGEAADEVEWATGASVMMRAAALRGSGLFDTGFFLYFEEVELMWRMRRAGWSIRHEPASRIVHVGGAATGVNGSRPTALRPKLPAYWYASRRRFLALTGSRGRAVAASAAWLAGHGLLMARRMIGSAKQHAIVERDARSLLKNGLLPTVRDRKAAVARWDDPPGEPPAWMG